MHVWAQCSSFCLWTLVRGGRIIDVLTTWASGGPAAWGLQDSRGTSSFKYLLLPESEEFVLQKFLSARACLRSGAAINLFTVWWWRLKLAWNIPHNNLSKVSPFHINNWKIFYFENTLSELHACPACCQYFKPIYLKTSYTCLVLFVWSVGLSELRFHVTKKDFKLDPSGLLSALDRVRLVQRGHVRWLKMCFHSVQLWKPDDLDLPKKCSAGSRPPPSASARF